MLPFVTQPIWFRTVQTAAKSNGCIVSTVSRDRDLVRTPQDVLRAIHRRVVKGSGREKKVCGRPLRPVEPTATCSTYPVSASAPARHMPRVSIPVLPLFYPAILDVDLQSDSSTQVPSFDAKEITNPWLADRRLGSGNGFLPTSSDMLLLRELLRNYDSESYSLYSYSPISERRIPEKRYR
ncbi:hypothetical protein KCU79_g143, partial [Aureobasidium melanogenum]